MPSPLIVVVSVVVVSLKHYFKIEKIIKIMEFWNHF